MAQSPYTDDQLILAARLYFIDDLPQAQIGKLVNVSQSKISRMLALARERGLVRVTVPDYDPRNGALEKDLKDSLGVSAVVIRSAAGLKIQDLRQTLGYFAASVVSSWIAPRSVVAIAGGRTMQALVEQMKPAGSTEGVRVVQAMGNIDSTSGAYDAAELGRQMASAWKGTFLTLNTPAILPDADVCRQLLGLEQIRNILTCLADANVALVGIGTLENSVFLERKVLGKRDIAALREAGAVGEILGRFYNAAGRECKTPLRERVVSLPLEELRRIPQVTAVVSGSDRSSALSAAIRGGLVKSLVIDERGAASLLGKPL
ncbi:MAG: transcriptional regulator with sigma factor-related N-terminal domain [Candidatus Solibacter sp.]|nr:transcriptional regulator with sigma factor-related N-terminal domain [Candidatus Solibacter sp.]